MRTLPVRYRYADWKETTLFERPDGLKVTRVEAEFAYEGALEGSTKVGYIMQYFPDQTGFYDGWELFEGRFEGKPSTALLRHEGTFDPQGVDARVKSVPAAGTGGLETVKLHFTCRYEGHGPYEIQLGVE